MKSHFKLSILDSNSSTPKEKGIDNRLNNVLGIKFLHEKMDYLLIYQNK